MTKTKTSMFQRDMVVQEVRSLMTKTKTSMFRKGTTKVRGAGDLVIETTVLTSQGVSRIAVTKAETTPIREATEEGVATSRAAMGVPR